MADVGNFIQRITDIIGSQYSTDAVYSGDMINEAINEVIDILPIDLLLKYSNSPTEITSSSGTMHDGYRILKVTRVDSDSGGIERDCKKLSQTEFAAASDSGSIYEATAFSPVYTVDASSSTSSLKILPDCNGSGQTGKIYRTRYVVDSYDSTLLTGTTLRTGIYLPHTTMHAITLKACINLLSSYLSNQVQDEEDSEMVQMIQVQIQNLNQEFISAMQRFTSDFKKPKGE